MIRQRIVSVMLALITGIASILLILSIIQGKIFDIILGSIGVSILCVLLIAHRRAWPWSAHVMVIISTVLTIISNTPELTQRQVSFSVLVPAVLSAMLFPWYWTIGTFIACMAGVAIQSGAQGPLFAPDVLILATFVAIGISLAGSIARAAQRAAEANAEQAIAQARLAEQKVYEADQKAIELAHTSLELAQQNEVQRRLLELVSTLETPVVTLTTGVLLAPIVGHLDSQRVDKLTNRLLHITYDQRPEMVIIDIAGVAVVDTAVARALLQTVEALRLLGCQVAITGISAAVATTITSLNISFDDVQTARSPQEILNMLGKTNHTRNNLALNMQIPNRW